MTTPSPVNDQNEALRTFLAGEIESGKGRLEELKPKLKAADYKLLDDQFAEKSEILDSATTDRNQLLILRREIGILRESAEALSVKPSLWSRIPIAVRVAIFTLPFLIYFLLLSIFQWNNQAGVRDYAATQSILATQAALPAMTVSQTPTPTQIP